MKKTIIIIALAAILIAGSAVAGIAVAAATVKPAGTSVLMETHKDTWTVVLATVPGCITTVAKSDTYP